MLKRNINIGLFYINPFLNLTDFSTFRKVHKPESADNVLRKLMKGGAWELGLKDKLRLFLPLAAFDSLILTFF